MTVSAAARPATKWSVPPLLRTILRYSVSTAGPVAVSAAHFIASLIFLRALPAREFGLFSFVIVVVSFGMSAAGALIVVPITQAIVSGNAATRPVCFKANWLVSALFAILLFGALAASGAPPLAAGVLAIYGAVFAWRWFARNMAYVDGRVGAAIASDLSYSFLLIGSLGALFFAHRLSFTTGSEIMLLAALIALLPFGRSFFRDQFTALGTARLRDYLPIFRDVSRWALAGVILTEVTVNAHAYLVTFISGPGAFALLALGTLLMRPAALVQSALPDLERPAMARAIAARDFTGLARIQRHFTWGLVAAWAGTIALAAAVLLFIPSLILKKGYDLHDVWVVAAISSVIMALRTLRTPPAVVMQAAGAFKEMVGIGIWSGLVAVAVTLALLMAFGPIASLGGIAAGELIILVLIHRMARNWQIRQQAHV
jgi:O-antigen/teichoic acid export membrane protein